MARRPQSGAVDKHVDASGFCRKHPQRSAGMRHRSEWHGPVSRRAEKQRRERHLRVSHNGETTFPNDLGADGVANPAGAAGDHHTPVLQAHLTSDQYPTRRHISACREGILSLFHKRDRFVALRCSGAAFSVLQVLERRSIPAEGLLHGKPVWFRGGPLARG